MLYAHAHGSPYRIPRNLAGAIAPDRRRLKLAVIAAVAFVAGLVVGQGPVAFHRAASTRHQGRAAFHERDFELAAPVGKTGRPNERSYPVAESSELAREMLLVDPRVTRALLFDDVASGTASEDDTRLLRAACEGLRDRACLEMVRGR